MGRMVCQRCFVSEIWDVGRRKVRKDVSYIKQITVLEEQLNDQGYKLSGT